MTGQAVAKVLSIPENVGVVGIFRVADLLIVTAVDERGNTNTLRLSSDQLDRLQALLVSEGFRIESEYLRQLDNVMYLRDHDWFMKRRHLRDAVAT